MRGTTLTKPPGGEIINRGNMELYSSGIVHHAGGRHIIKNYGSFRKTISYALLLFISLKFVIVIHETVLALINRNMAAHFVFLGNRYESGGGHYWFVLFLRLFFIGGFYLPFLFLANDIKKITIHTGEQKIFFKYGLIPFRKTKIVNIGEIREIAIHCTTECRSVRTLAVAVKTEEKIYNVDLIDENAKAYRIYSSTAYDDDLKNFAIKFSEITQIPVNDKNIAAANNIFKKLVI
jgi:hypothetical protein